MRHKTLLLIIYISIRTSFPSESSPNCEGGIVTNVDEGEISAPFSFLEPITCTWVLTPPPGHKLLVNIEQITLLSDTEKLFITIDKKPVSFNRHCQICLSNSPAEELNVTYVSNPSAYTAQDQDADAEYDNDENQNISSEVNYTSTANFHISYKSFDPFLCPIPVFSDDNGNFSYKNRSIGATLKSVCRDPYELVGTSISTCIASEDFPVPKWDPHPEPKCRIPECNGRILYKSATRNVGVIVHPGYPAKSVLSGRHCTWQIKAADDRRINLNFQSFSLPSKQQKKGTTSSSYMDVFDGSKDNLILRFQSQEESRNVTSKSNLIILELVTANTSLKNNDAAGEFGFRIEYVATCNSVPPLRNGRVLFADDVSVGGVVGFQCDLGFNLTGSSRIVCLPDLSWSHPMPVCHPGDDDGFSTSRVTVGKKQSEGVDVQDTNSKEAEKKDESLKGNKKIPTTQILPNFVPEGDESSADVKSGTVEEDKFTLLIIILAVVVPVVVLLLVTLGCFLWYRKQYPVRMGLGRKFETFENPAYERKRNKTAISDDPAELQKLTSLPMP